MVEFQKNKWKYSTIALLTILAIGFSFPQVFAAATDSTHAMIKDIQAKVNSIQSDTDDIQEALSQLPSRGQNPEAITISLHPDPADGQLRVYNFILPSQGKTFNGHMSGSIFADDLQRGEIRCRVGGSGGTFDISLVKVEDFEHMDFNLDFSCSSVYLFWQDKPGESNTDSNSLFAIIHYFETTDSTDISQ